MSCKNSFSSSSILPSEMNNSVCLTKLLDSVMDWGQIILKLKNVELL